VHLLLLGELWLRVLLSRVLLTGLVLGHLWLLSSHDSRIVRRIFLKSRTSGGLGTVTVWLILSRWCLQ
jgi:hypothetical protein